MAKLFADGKITLDQYVQEIKSCAPPVQVKDCKLVILHDDLKRLQKLGQQSEGADDDDIKKSNRCSPALAVLVDADIDDEIKPRNGRYHDRDEFAIALVRQKPGLLAMRPGAIKKELLSAAPKLFIVGYPDWWRNNPIFPKGKPGANPK